MYTVPDGHTFILKSIATSPGSPVPTSLQIMLQDSAYSFALFLVNQNVATQATGLYEHYHVLNSGDHITIAPSAGPILYWISGSLLQGEALGAPLTQTVGEPFSPPPWAGPPEAAPPRTHVV